MTGWELVQVTGDTCDECGNLAACNVYRKPHGCVCTKCVGRKRNSVYVYAYVCGYCMGKWLKTNGQFKVLDE